MTPLGRYALAIAGESCKDLFGIPDQECTLQAQNITLASGSATDGPGPGSGSGSGSGSAGPGPGPGPGSLSGSGSAPAPGKLFIHKCSVHKLKGSFTCEFCLQEGC